MVKVLYNGRIHDAEILMSAGRRIYDIAGEYVNDGLAIEVTKDMAEGKVPAPPLLNEAIAEAGDFDFDENPLPKEDISDIQPEDRKPAAGGKNSEPVADPRKRKSSK